MGAERLADEDDRAGHEVLDHRHGVADEGFPAEVVGPGRAFPMAALVEGDGSISLAELRDQGPPLHGMSTEPVQKHDGLTLPSRVTDEQRGS